MINTYKDYSFMDANDYKYTLSVEDDFVIIKYFDLENNHWKKLMNLCCPLILPMKLLKQLLKKLKKIIL